MLNRTDLSITSGSRRLAFRARLNSSAGAASVSVSPFQKSHTNPVRHFGPPEEAVVAANGHKRGKDGETKLSLPCDFGLDESSSVDLKWIDSTHVHMFMLSSSDRFGPSNLGVVLDNRIGLAHPPLLLHIGPISVKSCIWTSRSDPRVSDHGWQ
jgi:hypothetical protein